MRMDECLLHHHAKTAEQKLMLGIPRVCACANSSHFHGGNFPWLLALYLQVLTEVTVLGQFLGEPVEYTRILSFTKNIPGTRPKMSYYEYV